MGTSILRLSAALTIAASSSCSAIAAAPMARAHESDGPRFAHVAISVADLDAMRTWYQTRLELPTVVERFQLPDPPVRTVILEGASGLRVELIERKGGSRLRTFKDPLDAASSHGYTHFALEVNDLDGAYRLLSVHGGTGVWPPGPAVQPGSRFAYVKDPEGNLIELIQLPKVHRRAGASAARGCW